MVSVGKPAEGSFVLWATTSKWVECNCSVIMTSMQQQWMHQINTYMKSAANCDVHCKLQNPVSQYDFECDYVLKQFLGVIIFNTWNWILSTCLLVPDHATIQWDAAWTIHFLFSCGVRKVTTGITGLWQPSVHSDVALWSFDVGSSYHWDAEVPTEF